MEASLGWTLDEGWRFQFVTALAEVAGNIIRHAYPAGTPTGTMALRLCVYADRLEALFTDQGVAFVPLAPGDTAAPDVEDPAGLDLEEMLEEGRGLVIARAWLDQVEYAHVADGRNHWRLVKRVQAEPLPPDAGAKHLGDTRGCAP